MSLERRGLVMPTIPAESPGLLVRDPSLFWSEKALVVLHVLQLYGLVWQASLPWGAPYLWALYSQGFNWVNLDYFSTTRDGALIGSTADLLAAKWGEMSGYLYYALGFACAPYLLLGAVRWLWPYLDLPGTDLRSLQHCVIAGLLVALQLLYLPVCLAVFRLFYCDPAGRLDCDRDVSCSSGLYAGITLLCSALVLPLFLGLPYLLHRLIAPNLVYGLSRDHEKRLQATELAYALGLDSTWLAFQTWLCASFHRRRATLYPQLLALKAVFLLLFVFLRASLLAQGAVMWLLTSAFSLHCCLKWPYRTASSNYILFHMLFLLFGLSSYSTMDAFGVVNSFTVASTQFYGMVAFTGFALFSIAGVCVYSCCYPKDHDWPSRKTLANLLSEEHRERTLRWVAALREARDVRVAAFASPDVSLDVARLERSIRRLRRCWLAARSRGSIFEVLLSDSLDNLLREYLERYPKAPRRDEAFERVLRAEGSTLRSRADKMALVSPLGRRVLLKVLAIRAFGEDRIAAKIETPTVAPVAEKPEFFDILSYDPEDLSPVNEATSPLLRQTNRYAISDSDEESLVDDHDLEL